MIHGTLSGSRSLEKRTPKRKSRTWSLVLALHTYTERAEDAGTNATLAHLTSLLISPFSIKLIHWITLKIKWYHTCRVSILNGYGKYLMTASYNNN